MPCQINNSMILCKFAQKNMTMEELSYLYSIGHGNKSLEEFIAELNQFNIEYLIDIRSKPYSKFYPWFNKEALQHSINETNNIKYGYMGNLIGGLPDKKFPCYTDDRIDYEKLAKMDFFQEGLRRLIKANNKKFKTCIMCSEANPNMCHRTKLIGVELQKQGINLQHLYLTKRGEIILKSQTMVMNEILNNNNNFNNIFQDNTDIHLTSRKQYV